MSMKLRRVRSVAAVGVAAALLFSGAGCGSSESGGDASSTDLMESTTYRSTLGLALTSVDGDPVLVDGQSGSPASTEVLFRGATFGIAEVPLIDISLWWHDDDLIVVGFDCPALDPEALEGETATDCGAMSQTVLRVDLDDEQVSVVAGAVPVSELPAGPLMGEILLLDGGNQAVDLDDGTVTSGEQLPAGTSCGSDGGLVEIVPTSEDAPGAMSPTVRVRASLDDPGDEITAGLPWEAGRLGGVAGCTTNGVAVFATSDGELQVFELARDDDGLTTTRLTGPGLAPGSRIRVARDQSTLVATNTDGAGGAVQRVAWVGDGWVVLPDGGPGDPTIVTATASEAVAVSGGQTGATVAVIST